TDLREGVRPPVRTLLQTAADAAARQSEQAQAVKDLVSGFSDPTIIAGDFNSTPDSAIHHDLRRVFTDSWDAAGWGFGSTRTVGMLPMRIDYIYTTDALRTRHVDTFDCRCDGDRLCSDHRGLTATVTP
ncbi:MAG: endonuclease/exonuclease/phosphatase (EEP) superfamily protein YafD, partial [Myxococcota bacterium]